MLTYPTAAHLKSQVNLREIVALLWGQPERSRVRCHAVVEVGNICYTKCAEKSSGDDDKKNGELLRVTIKRKAEERRRQASALPPKPIHAVCPPHPAK